MSIPTLHLDRLALTFDDLVGGTNPPSQTVNVSDTTPGSPPVTMNFTATSDQSWLVVFPSSGSTPSSPPPSLTVSVTTGSLAFGVYTGHITVTAPGAFASPQTIVVTFNVGGTIVGGFAIIGTFTPLGDPNPTPPVIPSGVATTTTLSVQPLGTTSPTLTATVTVPGSGSPPEVPLGVVQFFDGTSPVAPISSQIILTAGSASFIPTLSVGAHSLSAEYTPITSTFLPSSSAVIADTVIALPVFVQSVTGSSTPLSAVMTATFPAGSVPSGSCIIAFIQTDNWQGGLPSFGVTDTQGNTYSFVVSANAGSSSRQIMAFVAPNAAGGAGTNTVTATASTPVQSGSGGGLLFVIHYENISPVSPVDHFASASGNDALDKSFTLQNTSSNELALFFYWSLTNIGSGGPPIMPSGTTLLYATNTGGGVFRIASIIQPASGTPTYTVVDPQAGSQQRFFIGMTLNPL